MLPNYFVQTQYNDSKIQTKKVKNYLVWSYVMKTISLVFVVLGFYNAWYFIGFVVLFAIGITLRQITLEMVGSFEYFLVNRQLIFSATTNFNIKKQVFLINLDDVLGFQQKAPSKLEANILASVDDNLYELKTYSDTIYFAPSKYMTALINNILRQQKNDISR